MLLCGTYYAKFGLKMSVCGARKIGTPLFKMAGSAPDILYLSLLLLKVQALSWSKNDYYIIIAVLFLSFRITFAVMLN